LIDHFQPKSTPKILSKGSCSHPDVATTLVSTAQPKNILSNIAFVEEPIDENLLSEIPDLLKPIHNFNYTRGRLEYRDPIRGSSE
jgi:L-galactose dehydrogenase